MAHGQEGNIPSVIDSFVLFYLFEQNYLDMYPYCKALLQFDVKKFFTVHEAIKSENQLINSFKSYKAHCASVYLK